MKIDWKRKLASRKFWAAVVGFISPIVIASGGSAELATQIAAIVMSGATIIAYIIGEGLTDAANSKKDDDYERKERNA